MATFVLSAFALPRLSQDEPVVAPPALEVTDSRDDYGVSEGDGLWIPVFVQFLEEQVRARARRPDFRFSDDYNLREELLAEVEPAHVRALLIEFINAHYADWRETDVACPDYDAIREDCRGFCDECESGWEETRGEYDGPSEEDVEPDEDADAPGLAEEERRARGERNLERRRERERRRAAREEAEAEVVDREFTCDEDCDSFLDSVHERYRDELHADTDALESRWEEFLEERGERDFPPLHPPLPPSRRDRP